MYWKGGVYKSEDELMKEKKTITKKKKMTDLQKYQEICHLSRQNEIIHNQKRELIAQLKRNSTRIKELIK